MPTTNLKALRDRLSHFDYQAEIKRIIEDNGDVLANLQAEQLSKGKRSDGRDIMPEYSPFTIQFKKEHGQGLGRITDRVTFYMTGALYRSLFTKIMGEKFDITSPSFKLQKIKDRSGEKVLGLNYDMRQRFIEEVFMPAFRARFLAATGLTIQSR